MQGWEVAAMRHGVPAVGRYCPLNASREMRMNCMEVYDGLGDVDAIVGGFGEQIARSDVSRGCAGRGLIHGAIQGMK